MIKIAQVFASVVTVILLSLAITTLSNLVLITYAQKPQTSNQADKLIIKDYRYPTPCRTHQRNDDGHGRGVYSVNGTEQFEFCTRDFYQVQFALYQERGLKVFTVDKQK